MCVHRVKCFMTRMLVNFFTRWTIKNTLQCSIYCVIDKTPWSVTFMWLHLYHKFHIFHNCGLLKTAGRMLQLPHPLPSIRQVRRIDSERKRESLLAAASISHARVQSGAEVAPALTPTPSHIAAVCFDWRLTSDQLILTQSSRNAAAECGCLEGTLKMRDMKMSERKFCF